MVVTTNSYDWGVDWYWIMSMNAMYMFVFGKFLLDLGCFLCFCGLISNINKREKGMVIDVTKDVSPWNVGTFPQVFFFLKQAYCLRCVVREIFLN